MFSPMPILNLHADNPMTDGRQSDRALAIRRGVARLFGEAGCALVSELPLASGRRADIICLDGKGRFTIIEIKSSIEDFRVDTKWPDYHAHCDAFFFATLPDVPREIFPVDEGLIVADSYGAEIIRDTQHRPLAGATRRALLLRFARASAGRLERVLAHCDMHDQELPPDVLDIDGA
jgi:hypothetical protein